MSIMAMTRQAARTQAASAGGTPPPADPRQAGAGDKAPLDSTLAKIAAYIPGEVVATYVAVLGIWQPKTRAASWGCFAAGMGLLIAIAWIGWALQRKAAATPAAQPTLQHLAWVFLIGAVAFTTYAMAVPGSAFAFEWSDATKFGAIAAFLLAAVLPSFGKLVGVDPDA